MYNGEDMRCLLELVETTTKSTTVTTTTASRLGLIQADESGGQSGSGRRPQTRPQRTDPTTPPGSTTLPFTEGIREKPSPTRIPSVQASFIAYRQCTITSRLETSLEENEKISFFYKICEWIRSFIKWRWKTFKTWSHITKQISFDHYNVTNLKREDTCWKSLSRCKRPNQVPK